MLLQDVLDAADKDGLKDMHARSMIGELEKLLEEARAVGLVDVEVADVDRERVWLDQLPLRHLEVGPPTVVVITIHPDPGRGARREEARHVPVGIDDIQVVKRVFEEGDLDRRASGRLR